MGLLQELTRYLEVKGDFKTIIEENDSLKEENRKLKRENFELDEQLYLIKQSKQYALDEIVLNQKRIDALLRQLGEKNGGEV